MKCAIKIRRAIDENERIFKFIGHCEHFNSFVKKKKSIVHELRIKCEMPIVFLERS